MAGRILPATEFRKGRRLKPAYLRLLLLMGFVAGKSGQALKHITDHNHAGALQLLTLELVHARGTYPDLIRREQEAWRDAAAITEGDNVW